MVSIFIHISNQSFVKKPNKFRNKMFLYMTSKASEWGLVPSKYPNDFDFEVTYAKIGFLEVIQY